jgi:hypothetical protein
MSEFSYSFQQFTIFYLTNAGQHVTTKPKKGEAMTGPQLRRLLAADGQRRQKFGFQFINGATLF